MKTYIGREYLQIYLDFLAVCGADVSTSQWMARHGHCLNPDNEFVPFPLIGPLRDEFATLTAEPLFPFRLGFYLADNLGTQLEYSLKSCHDLGEIADLSTRFNAIRSNVITPSYSLNGQQIEFELAHTLDDEDLWPPLLFATAALTYGFFRRLFGEGHQALFQLHTACTPPDNFAAIAPQIPFAIQFGSLRDCIAIDAACLTLVNPADDPRLKALLLQTVLEKSKRLQTAPDYRHKVRAILRQRSPHYPSMEDAASALHLSRRTLARRLQSENTTYLNILNEVRIEESVRYLERGMRVSEIASQLGYESTASFINLFKKKTGKTPSEYRKTTS